MSIQTVGVIGAGVMGVGVAQSLAQTGYQVILVDVVEAALERSHQEIKRNLRFQGLFQRQTPLDNIQEVMRRITFTIDYHMLSDIDFVIENVTEKWDIKKEVY